MTTPEPFIYLPENDYGIAAGYFDREGFVRLMRQYKGEPDVIQFLADMLEA